MQDIATPAASVEHFVALFADAVDFQDPVELTPDTVLAELPEWDSLASLSVIVMFDTEFGRTVRGETLSRCTTIRDVHALLRA